MKKRKIIGIVVLLIITLYTINRFDLMGQTIGKANKSNVSLPLNTAKEGVSIYYDTLKTLGYPTSIDASSFSDWNPDNIYIITEDKNHIPFELSEAEAFIKKGGKLIYLTDRYDQYTYPNPLDQYQKKAYVYTLGQGKLLIGDIRLITNETLLKDTTGAYFILKYIEAFKGNIVFNEYYRFVEGQTPSLYRNLPFYVKILFFQLIFTLFGCMFYLGKRFGKAKRIIDEIERDENEYLYASANLYEKGRCIDTVYHEFYTAFQRELHRTFKRIIHQNEVLHLWEKHHIPYKEKAVSVFNVQREINNQNYFMNNIKDLDELTQMLAKRRVAGWKRLKQRN
ncbi:hypothetical protein [Marinisporobacter balticus]|uniref:DUF4350 domain-containing protein n=1 Tax=Marinisporobacter balticus TaxID=2018667 RepID=A0A4V2SBC1_9FIRM|nr:hypothetical protein [Marinisporobacter balticus]TCO74590.1 hypothetical protein EV214_11269 [Marinisporobacter balticus]